MTGMAQNFVVGGLAQMWVVIKCGRTILAALLLHHQLRNGTSHMTDRLIPHSLSQLAGSPPSAQVQKQQPMQGQKRVAVHHASNRGLVALPIASAAAAAAASTAAPPT